jgi:hypothetical protein
MRETLKMFLAYFHKDKIYILTAIYGIVIIPLLVLGLTNHNISMLRHQYNIVAKYNFALMGVNGSTSIAVPDTLLPDIENIAIWNEGRNLYFKVEQGLTEENALAYRDSLVDVAADIILTSSSFNITDVADSDAVLSRLARDYDVLRESNFLNYAYLVDAMGVFRIVGYSLALLVASITFIMIYRGYIRYTKNHLKA